MHRRSLAARGRRLDVRLISKSKRGCSQSLLPFCLNVQTRLGPWSSIFRLLRKVTSVISWRNITIVLATVSSFL